MTNLGFVTNDNSTNAYGRNFRRAMAIKGVRASKIMELTGAASSTVGNWNRRGVSKDHAVEVARFLGVQPEKISQQYHVEKLARRETTGEFAVMPAGIGDDLQLRDDPAPEPAPQVPPESAVTPRTLKQRRLDYLCDLLHGCGELEKADLDLIESLITHLVEKHGG